jgi:hypothetical protein
MLSSQRLTLPFKIILSNTNNITTENLMRFFVDCILQQYLNLKKKDNHSAATSGRYCTIFLKSDSKPNNSIPQLYQ